MRITSIGAGNMASAIIKSVVSSGRVKSSDVTVFDINAEKYETFRKMSVNCADSLKTACDASEIILLAVKPQDYDGVLSQIKEYCSESRKIFISIAAGISTKYICDVLGKSVPVVRVMPNTPLMIGEGASAISRNEYVDDKIYTKICGLFAASGSVISLDESLMNKIISVNSSSPAYVYLLAKAMIDNAETQGIERDVAAELVYKTIKGAAEMLIHSELDADGLIKMVASPKGTTEAALKSFENDKFCDVVSNAMNACTARAEEMSR